MQKTRKEKEKIVASICEILTNENLNNSDLISVLSHLLFSIGVSLEECNGVTSEEVIKRYATTPTLGNALMAQAMFMKETWSQSERKDKNEYAEQDI